MISNRSLQQRTREAEGWSRAVTQDIWGCQGQRGLSPAPSPGAAPLRDTCAGCHPPEQLGWCSQRQAQGDPGSTRAPSTVCTSTGSCCFTQEQPLAKVPRAPPRPHRPGAPAGATNTRQPTVPSVAAAEASPAKPDTASGPVFVQRQQPGRGRWVNPGCGAGWWRCGAASLPGEAILVRLSSCHCPRDSGTQTLVRTAGPGGRGACVAAPFPSY